MSEHIDGERGISEVAEKSGISRRHGMLLIGVSGLAVAAWLVFHPTHQAKVKADTQQAAIHEVIPFEPPRAQPVSVETPAPAQTPAPTPPLLQRVTGLTTDPLDKAREAPLLGPNETTAQMQPAKAVGIADPVSIGGDHQTALGSMLKPTLLTGAKATVMAHPEMVLPMGTLLPCVLNTAMDSTAPGLVTCTLERDAYGATGNVVLLEKGTHVVGEYAPTMSNGQDRLFVLWDRAETPNHVVIALASPGADDLGRGGFDGQVDNHFWQKFQGAFLMTVIDGAFSLGTATLNHGSGTYLNIGEGQSAADTALENQINIAPTLRKNQGEVVSVMVARDLDLSDVYGLAMRSGAQ